MQNEFEKQVQQKVEELKLVPSAPVWQKVEMQIRQKKDRRKLIFWIPMLVLFLGGGLWVGVDQYSNNVAYNKKDVKQINDQLQKNSNATPEQTITTAPDKNRNEVELKEGAISRPHSAINVIDESQTVSSSVTVNSYSQRTRTKKGNSFLKGEKVPFENKTIATETKLPNEDAVQEPVTNEQSNKTTAADTTSMIQNKDTSLASVKDKTIEEKIIPQKNDSAVIKPAVKKQASSKWIYVFAFSAGRSGSGRLNLFNGFFGGQKSMDYAASPGGVTSGGQVYYPPSEVKKRGSFGIAVLAKKQLTKRSSFSTGLQYNYYSSSMLVGNRVSRDTMLGQYNVSQYYLNYPTNNAAITFESYHNRYHFVSLPFAIDWQLLRKVPLNLSTGLSFQYLVKTNGLMFDYTRQAYFHNKDAFSRFQLFSDLGLNYSLRVKSNSIAVGPQLQYGLSRLEKGNSNHHLFMYGLKAQWPFNKK